MLKNLTFAIAGAALVATPAFAASERENRTVGVNYSDLDLTTEDGTKELDRRIDDAAREACGMGERLVGSNIATRESRRCFTQAKRQLETHFAEIVSNQRRGG